MAICNNSLVLLVSIPYVLAAITAFVGNLLLSIIILRSSKSRRKLYSNFLLLLSFSDNVCIAVKFFGFQEILSTILSDTPLIRHSHLSCKLYMFVRSSVQLFSAYATAFLAVERFLILYFPIKGRLLYQGYRSWLIAAVIGLLCCLLQSYNLIYVEAMSHSCVLHLTDFSVTFLFQHVFDVVTTYLFPSALIILFNLLILRQILLPPLNHRHHHHHRTRRSGRTAKFAPNKPPLPNTNITTTTTTSTTSKIAAITTRTTSQSSSSSTPLENAHQFELGNDQIIITKPDLKVQQLCIKRNATKILFLVSFGYVFFHAFETGLSIYWINHWVTITHLKDRMSAVNSTSNAVLSVALNRTLQEMHSSTMFIINSTYCYINELLAICSYIGYGSNFYIYYFFGQNFKSECRKLKLLFLNILTCRGFRRRAAQHHDKILMDNNNNLNNGNDNYENNNNYDHNVFIPVTKWPNAPPSNSEFNYLSNNYFNSQFSNFSYYYYPFSKSL